MTHEGSDRDLGAILETWMDVATPVAVPERVLEEAFGRTVATRQARAHPWDWLARRGRATRALVPLGLVGLVAVLMVSVGVGILGGIAGIGPRPSDSPAVTAPASPPRAAVIPVTPDAAVQVVGPASMATDGKVVWVLTDPGQVVRIDRTANTAGAGIQLGIPNDFYNGIAVDRNGVWATDWSSKTLYRIDPTTDQVVATIPVGLAPKGVVATGSAVWVADTHGGAVLRIDPVTNTVVASITVGPAGTAGPVWLASGLGSIWVGVANDSTVVRIDPITNAIQGKIAIPSNALPCGEFAITVPAVWITSCEVFKTMTRIDPSTNTVVATVDLGGQAYMPVVIDGSPWVSIAMGQGDVAPIARVASATDTVDLELSPGPTFGGGGDMVVAAGSVWVIDAGHDRVLRLPLSAFTPG